MGNYSEKSKAKGSLRGKLWRAKGGGILYHASSKRGLKKLRPHAKSQRQTGDAPRVYASPSLNIAIAFMIRPTDDWCLYGSYDNGETWTLIVGDEKKFWKSEKKGGSLYTLAQETFRFTNDIGLGKDEWFSEEKKISVLAEERWGSVFQAMLHYGLKIYFLPSGTFEEFKCLSDKKRRHFLREAEPRKDGAYDIRF